MTDRVLPSPARVGTNSWAMDVTAAEQHTHEGEAIPSRTPNHTKRCACFGGRAWLLRTGPGEGNGPHGRVAEIRDDHHAPGLAWGEGDGVGQVQPGL